MDLLHIAVCDDETADLTQAMKLLANYDQKNQHVINVFPKAIDLLSHDFDIILLDLEMKPPTGFEVAKQLMQRQHPPVIIFTTKNNAYAVKGYGIALRYLQKPLDKATLFEAMDAAIMEASAQRLTVTFDDSTHIVRIMEIRYIDIFGHYTVIHLGDHSLRVRSSLKEIVARLPQGRFSATHKSYVVNFDYIRTTSANELWLLDGTRIPISRTKSAEFNQAFNRYLGR